MARDVSERVDLWKRRETGGDIDSGHTHPIRDPVKVTELAAEMTQHSETRQRERLDSSCPGPSPAMTALSPTTDT